MVKQETSNTKALYTKQIGFFKAMSMINVEAKKGPAVKEAKLPWKHMLENIPISNQKVRWKVGRRTNIKAIGKCQFKRRK